MTWPAAAAALGSACSTVFGGSVQLSPKAGGGPHTITGIFDENHVAVDVDAGVPVSSLGPAIGVNLADLPVAPVKGDTWTIGGTNYLCTDVQQDSEGFAVLLLQKKPQ